jgi:Sugar (pentulose and hexulose) kinases
MSPAMALAFARFRRHLALCRGWRVFQPIAAHRPVYDRAYQNYRETYERLKTLYPRLDPGGER